MKELRIIARSSLIWWLAIATVSAAGSDLRLIQAVKHMDREAVRSLLKQRIDVNATEGDGSTALHWAAHRNDLETVDQLVRQGAKVNAATDLGVMPLSLACLNGNAAIVDKLLSAGANPNAVMTGESALMTAARSGNAAIVKALLIHGANVNAKEPTRGQTALMWAASQAHPDVVRLLVEAGADIQARSVSYPIRVNYGGQSNNGGDPTNPVTPGDTLRGGSTPLLFAARSDNVEVAKILVAAGANVNDTMPDGVGALLLAARSGRTAMTLFLIDKGADPNANAAGYTALHAAVLMGDLDVVKALVAHGANPNVPLTKAAPVRRGNQELALPVGVMGATPFLLAAKFADVEILRVLAAAGGDPRIAMKSGTTPLMAAAGFGTSAGGGNRRGVGNRYTTVESSNDEEKDTLEAVKILLDQGADVNGADPGGNTALHGAAAQGYKTVVQYLVDKGGSPAAKNKRGQTPAEMLQKPPARSQQ